MNLLALLAAGCIAWQAADDADPFRPRVVPRTSPPLAIESDPPASDPTAPAQPAEPAADAATTPPPAAEPTGPRDDVNSQPATPTSPPADANLAPVGSVPRQRLRPPELIAEALATPQESGLQGRPLNLLATISRTPDRAQQTRLAQSYWRLAAAQANYHWALEERDLIDRFLKAHAEVPAVESARSAAAANVRDAQLAVAQAQQELGDLIGAGNGELPLAVDRPHVGSYNTLFADIFGTRPAPARIRLIDRTLPLRRQAIDAHGAAVVAAHDAVEATGEEFETKGQGLIALLELFANLHAERQAFMTAVRAYNDEIAEYLFAVARPGTSDQLLVSRLILTASQPPSSTSPPSSAVSPPATAPAGSAPAATQSPADAPPATPSNVPPTFEQPPAEGGGSGAPAGEPTPAAEVTTNYQPQDVAGLLEDGGGLYRGLDGLSAPARVQKLAGLLHWDRALPADAGRQTALSDCLRGVSQGQRQVLLSAYWQAREAMARYQARNDQLEQLTALSTVATALASEPGMAEAGVRLQAARRRAKAALVDAQLNLLLAQFDLMQAAGRPLTEAWLLPSTSPQAGRYVVGSHGAGRAGRTAEIVLARHAELEERADAVIRVDAVRDTLDSASQNAGAADATLGESTPLDRAVWAIGRQADETLAFLTSLTHYNLAIAEYALATAPQSIVSDELVKRLVIARNARGET